MQLKIDWNKTDLRQGQDWKQYYESLLPIDPPDPKQAEQCIREFEQAVASAYSPEKSVEKVRFIQAFREAAKGLDGPIHYPRVSPQPDPEGGKRTAENAEILRRSTTVLWCRQMRKRQFAGMCLQQMKGARCWLAFNRVWCDRPTIKSTH